MEMIIDISNGVYKGPLIRCRDCRKKRNCVIFEGLCDDDGYCSLGKRKEDRDNVETL